MISSPTKVKNFSNFPKKAKPLFKGYQFENKYFSTNYKASLNSLCQTYPKAKGAIAFSFKMRIYSKAFSQDSFSMDVIRIHDAVLRIASINYKMLPVGFLIYFDQDERCIKSTFYLLNYDKLNEKFSVADSIPHDLSKVVNTKIRERVCSRFSFTFDKRELLVTTHINDPLISVEENEEIQQHHDELSSAVYKLVSLFGDQEFRMALTRATRGLPLKKAQRFTSALNDLIDHNGDLSIAHIKSKTKSADREFEAINYINKRQSEDLLSQLGLD